MGPQEEPKTNGKRPINVELHSDEDEDGRNGGGEWQIGFEVEMHGIGVDQQLIEVGDTTTTEENDDSEIESTNSTEERGPNGGNNGYQQLPTSSAMRATEWLPPTRGLDLQPAPPLEELKIEHQPIGIEMDQEKADQIKQIMDKLAPTISPPVCMQNIDDKQLTELVRQMADNLNKKKSNDM